MAFFKDDEIPSCSICRYATEYIPSYTYPFFTPKCSKGHGECDGEKFCGDFRLINSYYCEDCEHLIYEDGFCNNRTYCEKKGIYVDKFNHACAYVKKR